MGFLKRLKTSGSVSLEAYYVMRASAPSLHRESTDSLILHFIVCLFHHNIKVNLCMDHTSVVEC